MKVVWKRPDGYHGATPSDYRVIKINEDSNIWLHKKDSEWFPFRVSGGWQDEDATIKLNSFINLIGKEDSEWLDHLTNNFGHSEAKDAETYYKETLIWFSELKNNLKGDTWEIEIMATVISITEKNIADSHDGFIKKVGADTA